MESAKVTPLSEGVPHKQSSQSPSYFKFTVSKPSLITISYPLTPVTLNRTWPESIESDPDLYVSTCHEQPSPQNCMWKSNNIGPDKVVIHPSDPGFKLGEYYVAVMSYREGWCSFSV